MMLRHPGSGLAGLAQPPKILVLALVCMASTGPLPPVPAASGAEPATPSEEEAEAIFEKLLSQFEAEKTRDPWERMPTVEKFATAPCEKTVRFLTSLYDSESNPGIRIAASHALGKIGTEDAVKALITVGIPYLSGDYGLDEVGVSLKNPLQPEAEEWLVKNGLSPQVRANPKAYGIVLEALARLETPKRIPVLLRELRRAPPEAQTALLETLRPIGAEDSDVARAAVSLLRSPNPAVQVAAHEVLAAAGGKTYRQNFLRGLKSPHWEVRALSVEVLSDLEERSLVRLIAPLLEDSDKRVRISVVWALMEHGGAEVIEPLIGAMEDTDPRVQDDIADALARLTGKNFGPFATQWESWWAQNKGKPARYEAMSTEEFARLKEEDRINSKTVYFGLRVQSNFIAFCFDSSQSMGEPYTPREESGSDDPDRGKTVVIRPVDKARKEAASANQTTKLDIAKKELISVVRNLQDTQAINIFSFNTIITDFVETTLQQDNKRLARLLPTVRPHVNRFVLSTQAAGLTNLLGAIKAALEYQEVDTIYLLSDGAPTVGVTDHEKLLAEVERLNRRSRVKINTISFDPKEDERRLLQALADQNYGVYVEK